MRIARTSPPQSDFESPLKPIKLTRYRFPVVRSPYQLPVLFEVFRTTLVRRFGAGIGPVVKNAPFEPLPSAVIIVYSVPQGRNRTDDNPVVLTTIGVLTDGGQHHFEGRCLSPVRIHDLCQRI